ncbi:IST1-like protein [Tanacetum coccineum]
MTSILKVDDCQGHTFIQKDGYEYTAFVLILVENKQLLVLGGNGFVGSYICKEALDRGFSVASLSSFLYQLIISTWNPNKLDAMGESLLNELRIVEDMKRQCNHKSFSFSFSFCLALWQTFYMRTPDGDCGAIALQTRFETTKGKLLQMILFSTESIHKKLEVSDEEFLKVGFTSQAARPETDTISSLCSAAPRCTDLPELYQVQMDFARKHGKEFMAAVTELMPKHGVSLQVIE